MKLLKKKMIWFGIIAVAAIALFIVTMIRRDSSIITGFASGLMAVSLVKLFQFYRISKNPKLLKKYEIEQKEERFIAISEKSGRFTFMVTLFVEFVAIFVLIIIGQSMLATIVAYIAAIQGLAYLITYYYLCKKY